MEHYVCSECGGMSEHAKVCETADCARKGEQLTECTCEDNTHAEVMSGGKGADDTAAA